VNPCITGLASALPATRFSQDELRLAYRAIADGQLRPLSLRMLDRIFAPGNGIRTRSIACAEPRAIGLEGPDELHARFCRHAVQLGTEALRGALERAGVEARELAALIACTCTGYLCPGLTSYLAENLGLREDFQAFDLVGMGCGASVPALRLAQQIARGMPGGAVAVVSAEICSATAYFADDPELIVSNCIFADGAAAAVVAQGEGAPDHGRPLIELIDFESTLCPEHREKLRFRQSGGRLRNCLARSVPGIAAEMAERTLGRLLARRGLDRRDIAFWAVHPGGKKVLECFAERLGLAARELEDSYDVLARCGNMSSPSVLFVLESIIARRDHAAGALGICAAFGAGLSCHLALVRTAGGSRPGRGASGK
jgi:predicted naringenin-chalcone synthase